jgi:hypothetical protein
MPHAEASIIIRASRARVAQLYRDYQSWPQLFSATVRGVRLVRSEGGRTELEIDHREGKVPNVMTEVSPERVDLWEAKRRYEGSFVNRFELLYTTLSSRLSQALAVVHSRLTVAGDTPITAAASSIPSPPK